MPFDEIMAAAIEKQKKTHYLSYLTNSIEILLQIYIRSIFVIYEIQPHDIFASHFSNFFLFYR